MPRSPMSDWYFSIYYCPQCGKLIRADRKFCSSCGTPRPVGEDACHRCGGDRGPFGFTFNAQTWRCRTCEREIAKAKQRFRSLFLQACSDDLLEEYEWAQFDKFCADHRFTLWEALSSVKTDALNLMQRTLVFAKADDVVTPEEEQTIYALQRRLHLADKEIKHIRNEIEYVKMITNIRRGNIPTMQPTIILDADELCYWEASATYIRPRRAGPMPQQGRVVITNRKVMFLAQTGGMNIPIKSIVQVSRNQDGVYLELSRARGNGFYHMDRPDIVGEMLETLVRMDRRQLVKKADGPSRHIPHNVKKAVWQRDGGKCVECRATDYLEFDHIIPFSKGGASTTNNIQLLCRRCNLKKADSI